MAVNSVLPPFPTFCGADGKPLQGGLIYIGQPGLEARSAPKQAYFDPAMTVPAGTASGAAVQTSGGYPTYLGAPAMLYVDGDFSMTVTDKAGVVVYSALNRTFAYSSGITAPQILAADGNLVAVGFGYQAEPNTGHIRSSTGAEDDVILGTPVSRRTLAGTEFMQPVVIDAIRSVTNIDVLTVGEGVVAYTNTATGAESGLGAYSATLTYRGFGGIAVQEAYVPGKGVRYRAYASGTWGAWGDSITSAQIKAALGVGASFGSSGWARGANGEIIQWGVATATGAGAAVTFPMAFPNACRVVVGTHNGTGAIFIVVNAFTTTGFTAYGFNATSAGAGATGGFSYIAIGN